MKSVVHCLPSSNSGANVMGIHPKPGCSSLLNGAQFRITPAEAFIDQTGRLSIIQKQGFFIYFFVLLNFHCGNLTQQPNKVTEMQLQTCMYYNVD